MILIIHTDSGPMNLTIASTYDNGVRLKWKLSPTCYERTEIIVISQSFSGKLQTWRVNKDADWFDLTGLDSETNYNLTFITAYGHQRSNPSILTFKTLESPHALTAGAIAGISVGKTKDLYIFIPIINMNRECIIS